MPPTTKTTIIVSQFFISGLMALLMSFAMSILPIGFADGWLFQWMQNWLTSWPIAFVLSLMVCPVAFKLASLTLRLLPIKRTI
ncbi:DUF2798 domain-containing protein [Pseudooceanicola sediminis]|uniref:DUF2798 domain-containing protein n=1 Tax=Pseudooceanicola sediminis TaxID=2211117 RepID=A0A399J2M6_9RHOB|nr:DUF2798 domain-containing protein [Pseudooceanicola sediminis]KAA2317252.1 DUF2798 domain-containing protein [Puniceibacterium sp. HSS470]RII39605.1 DUF2798 domain-containing protein [Pseudooceanicola sediminis]|tara:strand:- start:1180 stop:1428 length:249 start_codon:yes stop_codon:yes gene_type:complete